FLFMIPLPPRSTLFPYTTLFRSLIILFLFLFSVDIWFQLFLGLVLIILLLSMFYLVFAKFEIEMNSFGISYGVKPFGRTKHIPRDRKSTRLNSSHVKISYAVFCL